MLIDYNFCIDNEACYKCFQLQELFPEPIPIQHVLTRTDGPWRDVPANDRLWVATCPGAIPRDAALLWSVKLLERALSLIPLDYPTVEEALRLLREDKPLHVVGEKLESEAYPNVPTCVREQYVREQVAKLPPRFLVPLSHDAVSVYFGPLRIAYYLVHNKNLTVTTPLRGANPAYLRRALTKSRLLELTVNITPVCRTDARHIRYLLKALQTTGNL